MPRCGAKMARYSRGWWIVVIWSTYMPPSFIPTTSSSFFSIIWLKVVCSCFYVIQDRHQAHLWIISDCDAHNNRCKTGILFSWEWITKVVTRRIIELWGYEYRCALLLSITITSRRWRSAPQPKSNSNPHLVDKNVVFALMGYIPHKLFLCLHVSMFITTIAFVLYWISTFPHLLVHYADPMLTWVHVPFPPLLLPPQHQLLHHSAILVNHYVQQIAHRFTVTAVHLIQIT